MQQVSVEQALDEVKGLYQKILGRPAPTVEPQGYVPFPQGAKPLDYALYEREQLKRFTDQLAFTPTPVTWIPRADCFLDPEVFTARLEIPGVDRDSVKVLCKEGNCVVRGERKPPEEGPQRLVALERPWGPFERWFQLPPGSRTDEVKAVFREGLLELTVPIKVTEKPSETQVEAT